MICNLNLVYRQRRMYKTGIYDLNQLYGSKFYTEILFKTKNNRMPSRPTQEIVSGLDKFKSKKQIKEKSIKENLRRFKYRTFSIGISILDDLLLYLFFMFDK